jgi:hypothetical protein
MAASAAPVPSGGVDFAGATVSIAIGGAETSLVLNASARFRIMSRAPDGTLTDFLVVGPAGEFGGSTCCARRPRDGAATRTPPGSAMLRPAP